MDEEQRQEASDSTFISSQESHDAGHATPPPGTPTLECSASGGSTQDDVLQDLVSGMEDNDFEEEEKSRNGQSM
ncbi:hypothetical protein GN956_G18818 [Arapaima gigas]